VSDAVPPEFPRTGAALRQALEAAGFRPRRRHGQNFLTDAQAVDAIVRDAAVVPGDFVVEVGTGPGLLTHALCEAGASVLSFDIDADLQRLARRLRVWPEEVRFEVGDVLAGKHALAPQFAAAFERADAESGPVKLVSNLPYSAATPILMGVLSLPRPPDRIVVMVQEEVGEKMLATAGRPDYGVPSIAVALKAKGRIARRFGPQVFWPRPKVRSVVLDLAPLRPSLLRQDEHGPFGLFLIALFTRRRKVLTTALRTALPGLGADAARAALAAQGLDLRVRAEAVEPGRLLALWRALRPEVPDTPARPDRGADETL